MISGKRRIDYDTGRSLWLMKLNGGEMDSAPDRGVAIAWLTEEVRAKAHARKRKKRTIKRKQASEQNLETNKTN